MGKRRNQGDLDGLLRKWPYDPQGVSVRTLTGTDGRRILQMRVDLGVLQLETDGRPDGDKPGGMETYYDLLVEQSFKDGEQFALNEEQCAEVDREFVQYYHRRTCWLAMREFRNAVTDADHTLALMDFTKRHAEDEQWILSHEQYRPFVLFQRTQAQAMGDLEEHGPEVAIDAVNRGLDELRHVFSEYDAEEHYEDDELVQKLVEMREALRSHYEIGNTLAERLHQAVAEERYEEAARLRDELEQRRKKD